MKEEKIYILTMYDYLQEGLFILSYEETLPAAEKCRKAIEATLTKDEKYNVSIEILPIKKCNKSNK